MVTVGEMLRQQRLRLKLTYTGLADLTKISVVSLKALEKNQFGRLPAYPFLKGMVQNYAKVLGLDPMKAVAVFKRDYTRQQKKPAALPGKPLGPGPWRQKLERPAVIFAAAAVVFSVLVGWSWWRVYQPPQLIIDTPADGQTAVSPVTVAGRTDRDAGLSLNGITLNLTADGRFETKFEAGPGSYELVLKAVSRRQKTSEKRISVIVIE